MKNKGELLIESLFSIFLLSIILIPVSKSIYVSYKTLYLSNEKLEKSINDINTIELVKSYSYKRVLNLKNRNIDIEKTNMYIEKGEDKIYILKIKVGDYEDLWIPK